MSHLRKLASDATTIKMKREFRGLALKADKVNVETRTIDISFSSELPVERWFGDEVLSHGSNAEGKPAYNFDRLNNGAPLLFNHNWDDLIGVVEKAWVGSDKRAYATIRFSKNARGEQMMQDLIDGILRNVSFGYQVYNLKLVETADDGPDVYMSDNWEVFEISMVSVPADPTVGPGRDAAIDLERDVPISRKQPAPAATHEKGSSTMTQEEIAAAEAAKKSAAPVTVPAVAVDPTPAINAAIVAERGRVAEIIAMGEKCHVPTLARKLADTGATVSEAREKVLDELSKNPTGEQTRGLQVLDLTDREAKNYSLIRAVRACIDKDWKSAGFERECSEAIQKKTGKESNGFFMPMNIALSAEQERAAAAMGRRDLSGSNYAVGTAGTGTTGGTLVATDLMASQFIEVLRKKARVVQAGARMLSGLVGNVDLPRQTSATSTYWVGEGADLTESEAAFDKVTLSPKTLGAYSQISRNMMLQSTPDIEVVVRDDLASVLALAIDLAALSGSNSGGQPKGLLNVSGIGSVVGGTSGAPLTIDHLIQLETAVMAADAPEDTLAYLCNAQTIGTLKGLKSTTGQYLWNGGFNLGGRGPTPGEINGYPVYRTNQLTAAGSKSGNTNLSTLAFGNWSELFIGEWGVLEILPNPFGIGFKNGGIDIRALQTVDVQLRHPASFAAMTDAQATAGHTYS